MNNSNNKGSIFRNMLVFIGIPLLVILMLLVLYQQPKQEEPKYYEIVQLFDDEKVTEYTLNLTSGKLEYKLKSDEEDTAIHTYSVPDVNLFLNDIHDSVIKFNSKNPDSPVIADYKPGNEGSWLINLLPTLLLVVAMILLWIFIMRRMNSGMGGDKTLSFGKVKTKQVIDDNRKTTFDDVAGADEEKEELEEIVEFLKEPKKFNDLGARIPKGVLLVGPPGTGKTLLARAVAGEAGAPFFSISGSDFVEMFVGVGASRVRDLFVQAKKNSPSIIFIDEIDAVGRHRGAGLGGGHDEREQTLNQLLVEMDGFGTNEGVIIIAATNRPDILDPALLRPGRFDRQVMVGYPDIKGREAILKVHARKKPLAPDVDLRTVAQSTAGFTGADLENLLNEAALMAAKRGLKAITMKEIEEASIKVVVGTEKKSKKISGHEKKLTSYHEAGHAVTTYYCPTQDDVHQISIIPRGMAGGYTMAIPTEDRMYRSRIEMFESIVVLLGGRVAELLTFDDISTGASNDIERATEMARNMVTKYGMSDKLGPISFGSSNDEIFLGKDYTHTRNYSETIATEIDEEIHSIIRKAYDQAKQILRDHSDKLAVIAEYLNQHEKLDGESFKLLMEGKELPSETSDEASDNLTSKNSDNNADSITNE